MKYLVTLILCCLLLLTSCNPQQSPMGGREFSSSSNKSTKSSEESISTGKVSEISSEQVISSTNTETGKYNAAFAKLYPDFVPTDKALFYVENLGFQEDVPWNRINQIKNLDRGNYETGAYQIYYLITPIYVGSKIKLYPIDIIERDPYFIHGGLIYESLGTPDDYALLLTSIEPETFYDYELIMGKGERETSYRFQYDGSGDRPSIEQVGGKSASAFRNFEIVDSNKAITGLIPYPYGENLPFIIKFYEGNGTYYQYDISYFYIEKSLPESSKKLVLRDGRICFYGTDYDSPLKWYYALPYGDEFLTCYIYYYNSNQIDGAVPPPWDVSEDFKFFLESLQVKS